MFVCGERWVRIEEEERKKRETDKLAPTSQVSIHTFGVSKPNKQKQGGSILHQPNTKWDHPAPKN
jgi:hypothetical protein